MQCPYCNADLKPEGEYYSGRPESFSGTAGNGIYYPSTQVMLGEIFHCPNRDYFEDDDQAKEYKEQTKSEADIDEICCDSHLFNGFFYTDRRGDLHEGYPC